ncbi:daunorubicin resistance protein DrrA family ABC transporter ATP-binding protein [Vulcanisaeta distributa]|uniref:Daunorubicin resistance ABC transporter ATPase subunit n=1 Tax=Vulcanisaeta distributa (strain DSM 14429 / JCM 11212 / NBRC 100878 / IC-017) TaxID=572478 RepID=E1QTT2_VULDI|nr:daunorubicin resistance protein DrrA family ABC transporter ATP-binding protein [Vulcanisaeta distributa]ADN50999.1 daunorubicin resistance ABC transporter ATPase subunit [Vulcanisaeta distributa DSM 14429]
MQAIKVRDLVKIYSNGVRALDGVSLGVDEGEVFAMLGPNGAGKTTLMRILTTQIRPTSGSAYVMGYDVVREGDKVRRVIGYVPQEFSVWMDLTGYENLLIYSKVYGVTGSEARRRIREVLELMDLMDAANRLVGTYSGGMIRRLEIATALIIEPEVLFLDEPTVGLDPAARRLVWEKLIALNKERDITIFFNSHYMDEVEIYARRAALLNRGKVIALGTIDELKSSISNDVIELVVNDAKLAVKILKGVSNGVIDVNIIDEDIVRVMVRNADESLPILISTIFNHGISIRRVSVHKPSLDDVFLKYVGKRISEIEGSMSELRTVRKAVMRG